MTKRMFITLCAGLTGLILIIFVISIVRDQGALKLVETSPKSGFDRAGTADILHFRFNKPLSPQTAKNFSIHPELLGEISIQGAELTFTPTRPYQLNQSYSADLKQAHATDGSTAADVHLTFTVNPPDFSALTKQQQADSVNKPDTYEKNLPYKPAAIYLTGETEMRKQGASDAQVNSLKEALFIYSNSVHQVIRQVVQNNVVHVHTFDRNTGASSDSFTFDGVIGDSTNYKAKLILVDLNSVHLYLSDQNGSQFYDSGVVPVIKN